MSVWRMETSDDRFDLLASFLALSDKSIVVVHKTYVALLLPLNSFISWLDLFANAALTIFELKFDTIMY